MIHVDVHAASRGHIHLDLRFLLVASDEEPSPSPGESQQVRWCSWPEAQRLADEALSGALKVARLQPEVCGASSASLP